MIEIQQLSKQYGDSVVVDDVNLELPANGVTAIIGPNGAGKSTLLSMISRLLPMSAGQVKVDGLDVTRADSRELARRLSILRQDNHLPLRLTVHDLVAFGRYPHTGGRLTLEDKAHRPRHRLPGPGAPGGPLSGRDVRRPASARVRGDGAMPGYALRVVGRAVEQP